MPLISILESKSQNGTQIFTSLKMVPFFVKMSHVDAVRQSAMCQFPNFLKFLLLFFYFF